MPKNGYSSAQTVAPHDTNPIAFSGTQQALWIGGGGNLAVQMLKGRTAVTLLEVPSGTLLPIRVFAVMSTGTTATAIVALGNGE